jgi:serine/threonine protein kinase
MIVKDLPLLRSIYLQLINGISAMHSVAGHAHMDIKLENVLITGEGLLQFCDFGFTCPTQKLINQKMGTAIYMAPEIHNAKTFPCKA